MIERIPNDILTGGDAVLGNSALATAGCVPYVASPGVLTEDQYFKYVQWPGSPVAGNTFNRINFTDANPPTSSYYDVNAGYDISVRRTYTARPFTATGSPTNMAPLYLHSSYKNVAIGTAGGINSVSDTDAANTTPVDTLYGVAGNSSNYGTGLIGEHNGLYFTAFNFGGDINFSRGIYSGNATVGAGNVTTLRGIDNEATGYGTGSVTYLTGIATFSGNWGTSAPSTGVTNHTGLYLTTVTDGPISSQFAIRSLRQGTTDPATAWGISEETGWNNRFLGKTAIGPSYSTAPTNTLQVKDATATTGATSVLIDIGAAQTAASTVLTLNGVLKYAGTNTTGAKSAALGSNCPATTETAPYTWFRMVSSDGSTVYVPAWK